MYSQYEEEKYILEATPKGSRFLDIGAWHATDKSNTRALYERGDRGIVVEPSPGPLAGLIRAYGPDVDMLVLGCAITLEPGPITLIASDDALTTSNMGSYLKWKDAGGFYGRFVTNGLTLEQFFACYGGAFGFINFDVEGTSVDLFRRMLSIGPEPACVCIEHDDRIPEIMTITDHYNIIYGNGTNVVLQRKG